MLTRFSLNDDTDHSDDSSSGAAHMETFAGGHSHQIGALISIPDNITDDALKGGYVSGCKDNNIRIFNSKHELVSTLCGHDKPVTSLSWVTLCSSTNKTYLVSGSWDGTAKLWNVFGGGIINQECVCTLPDHENTVCVLGLSDGCVATGSAGVAQGSTIVNHKIRIWDLKEESVGGGVKATIKTTVADHGGPIRGLCLDEDTQCLASCSNDGTIKIRDASTAETLYTLTHPNGTPLVLNITSLGNGTLISVTEDGNAYVWDTTSPDAPPQAIPHPNCVWTVLPLPNNRDFVTGCHDGMIRIFTKDVTRHASPTEIEAFHNAVIESKSKQSSGPSADEISKLPKWEMNSLITGKSDGMVQVFNKNNTAIAAQWSATSSTWIEVGEVTGRNDNAGQIDGVSYDFVFPIEIDMVGGGVQTLKIGYNTGDNPFVTAQTFIDKHELDQNYLAQIADYVRQRAGSSAPTLGMEGAATTSTASSARASSTAAAPPPTPSYIHLPMKSYMTFETGTTQKAMEKILLKIKEFNTSLQSNTRTTEELECIQSLTVTLVATSRYHATSVKKEELQVIQKILKDWPVDKVFPALDLARLVVLHPDANSTKNKDFWMNVVRLAIAKCKEVQQKPPEGMAAVAIPMLSLRLFANAFKGAGSVEAVAFFLKGILESAEAFAKSTNKNIRLSVATTALNATSYMNKQNSSSSVSPTQIFNLFKIMTNSGLYDSEAMTRALVAFGTFLLVSDEAKTLAKEDDDLKNMMKRNVDTYGNKAIAVSQEICSVLKW